MTREQQKIEVVKRYLNGTYNNRELAKEYQVSSQSVCSWLNNSPIVKYHKVKQKLEKELDKFIDKQGEYSDVISRLLDDIARINRIIDRL